MADLDRVAVQNDKTYTVVETGKVDDKGDVTEIQKVKVTAASSMEKLENGIKSLAQSAGCDPEDAAELIQGLSLLNAVAFKGTTSSDRYNRERFEEASSSRSRSRNARPAVAARAHPPAPAKKP